MENEVALNAECSQRPKADHANVYNLFDLERHYIDRETQETLCSAALAEWQEPHSVS